MIFTSTRRGICVSDAESLLIEAVNPAFAKMHGGGIADFVGQPVSILLPPARRLELPQILARMDREDFVRVESEHVRLDGSTFPVGAELLSVADEQGRLKSRIAWFEDLSEQRGAEVARREANDTFETAFSQAPMGIAMIDLDGRFVRVNAALCELLARSEHELVGSTSQPFTHPDDRQLTADAFAHLTSVGTPLSVQKRYLRPDGEVVWADTRGTAVAGSPGRPGHIVSHFNDITAVKLAQQLQAEATAQFETAFADAPIGMALVAIDGRLLKVNRVLCQQSGYSAEQLLATTFQEMTHPDDLDADLEQLSRLVAGEIDRYAMEKRYFTAEGGIIWTNLAVSLVRDADGQPLHFVSQLEDITERKRLEVELQHLADYDSLTELWNRRRFHEQLESQVARCRRYGEEAALLMIDLDGFKHINDTYGHEAGDALLKRIAGALSDRVRVTDSVARLGGDEFAVLLAHVSAVEADRLAVTLGAAVENATVKADDTDVSVTASIGVETLGEHTTTCQQASAQADAAMYRAKAQRASRTGAVRAPALTT